MRRAILMDRDGTISEEVGDLSDVALLRLIDDSAEAVRKANEAGFQTVVVTNQSGVARGILSEDLVAEAHDRLRELLGEHGARLDGIYYCPHHPEAGGARYRKACDCRKPLPGMLRRARDEMGIDLPSAYMIGDSMRDVAAGRAVGAFTILVLTGFGRKQLERRSEWSVRPDRVARDLRQAVEWILDREHTTPFGPHAARPA
jgi:D-glycero-D-manno-heptose 1,7-bisphosphate phosphatase